jgi:hypothetical protein
VRQAQQYARTKVFGARGAPAVMGEYRNGLFLYMVVTTFQHLFGIRMHHSAAPDIKKCRHFPGHHA